VDDCRPNTLRHLRKDQNYFEKERGQVISRQGVLAPAHILYDLVHTKSMPSVWKNRTNGAYKSYQLDIQFQVGNESHTSVAIGYETPSVEVGKVSIL